MRVTCPDCRARLEDRHMSHDGSCPLSSAADAVQAADRDHFLANPGVRSYRRPLSAAEVAEMRMVGQLPEGADVQGVVEVVQLAPGVRLRRLVEGYAVFGGAR